MEQPLAQPGMGMMLDYSDLHTSTKYIASLPDNEQRPQRHSHSTSAPHFFIARLPFVHLSANSKVFPSAYDIDVKCSGARDEEILRSIYIYIYTLAPNCVAFCWSIHKAPPPLLFLSPHTHVHSNLYLYPRMHLRIAAILAVSSLIACVQAGDIFSSAANVHRLFSVEKHLGQQIKVLSCALNLSASLWLSTSRVLAYTFLLFAAFPQLLFILLSPLLSLLLLLPQPCYLWYVSRSYLHS